MTVVVDASVATKWLLPEPDSDLAERVRVEDLVVPPMFRLECGAALIKRLRLGQLTAAAVTSRLGEVLSLPVIVRPVDEEDVLRMAVALRHPVHDCAYLSLAQKLGLQLVTADRRMRDAVVASARSVELLPFVLMLSDYA